MHHRLNSYCNYALFKMNILLEFIITLCYYFEKKNSYFLASRSQRTLKPIKQIPGQECVRTWHGKVEILLFYYTIFADGAFNTCTLGILARPKTI